MAEEVLKSLEDIETRQQRWLKDSYSFYGLSHWLSEANHLLDQIDQISSPETSHELALVNQKDELLDAQTQLRRQMGALLEDAAKEPLTRRERPQAQEFLEAQLQKLLSQANKERVATAVSRLQDLLVKLKSGAPAVESKDVRDLEAQMKQADAQWKELEPIYVKWQAGRHSFKSNAELQSFKRRYEEAKKLRDTGPERLEAALRRRRTAEAPSKTPAASGWAARKAPAKAVAPTGRGAAAIALDQPKAKAKSSWTSGVTLAQRLRAEAAAQVRSQAPEAPVADAPSDDDVFWEETVRPPPPPIPKAAPQDFVAAKSKDLPAAAPKRASLASMANGGRRWGPPREAEESEEEAPEPAQRGSAQPKEPKETEPPRTFAASAKKKGKKKKGKSENEEDEVEESPAPVSTKSWILTLQAAVAHTVLEDLLRRESWTFHESPAAHLAKLAERLPWQSPLGFLLPFPWSSLVALEVDGGPKRRSRRGQSDALERLRHNVPRLLPFYLTLVFGLLILHSLSHFGLLMWILAAQSALLLLPCQPNKASAHVQGLQLVHLLLWVFFVRSIWQMHIFIKIFCVAFVVGHAYSVNLADE